MAGYKIILRKNSDNFGAKLANVYLPIEGSLLPYLCDEIWIEKGVTFEEFFNIIMKHHEEYSIAFYSHLSGIPLSDFAEEWAKPADRDIKSDGMQKIVIRWGNMGYLDEKELQKDGLLEISWLPEFMGMGKDEGGYGIEFTPLNELKPYPMELIEDTYIYNLNDEKKLAYMERGFTVYEVLSAIFYEITFVGGPKSRSEKLTDLITRGNEIDEEFKEEEPKTLDDILKNLNIDKPKEENE